MCSKKPAYLCGGYTSFCWLRFLVLLSLPVLITFVHFDKMKIAK